MSKIDSINQAAKRSPGIHFSFTGMFELGEIKYRIGNLIFFVISEYKSETIFFIQKFTSTFKKKH
ncbi:MAG: hypothetical protein FMNOHCHN_02441 [Ignavibacteriaceae bacterium]|nr:hypothetical protein [Ignavibacteriaceae bacterium]